MDEDDLLDEGDEPEDNRQIGQKEEKTKRKKKNVSEEKEKETDRSCK